MANSRSWARNKWEAWNVCRLGKQGGYQKLLRSCKKDSRANIKELSTGHKLYILNINSKNSYKWTKTITDGSIHEFIMNLKTKLKKLATLEYIRKPNHNFGNLLIKEQCWAFILPAGIIPGNDHHWLKMLQKDNFSLCASWWKSVPPLIKCSWLKSQT